MKRFLCVSLLAAFVLFSGVPVNNAFSQQASSQSEQTSFTDQNTTPSQFHQMLAEMKQERLNKLREAGLTVPMKETLAQSYYDARYYRLDLSLNNTTEIISGSVYIYGEALIDGFNVLELNFFDNSQMYVDSVKSNGATVSYTWSNDIIRIFLNGTYDTGENFGATVFYHGHPLEGGLQSFDWGYHGSPSMPIMSTLSEPYFAQSWWPCKDLPRDKAGLRRHQYNRPLGHLRGLQRAFERDR